MRAIPAGETSSAPGTAVQQTLRTASLPTVGDHSSRASTSKGEVSVMVTVTDAGMVSVGPPGGPTLIRPRPGVMSMRIGATLVNLGPESMSYCGLRGCPAHVVHGVV